MCFACVVHTAVTRTGRAADAWLVGDDRPAERREAPSSDEPEAELSRLRREKYKRGVNKLMKLNRMNSFFSVAK